MNTIQKTYITHSSIKKISKKSEDSSGLYITAAALIIMLLLRDTFDVKISKFVFLGIIAVAVLAFDLKNTIALYCFIMPLYVGLPGNFITPLLIVKFLAEYKQLKIRTKDLLLVIAIMSFVSLQNLILGYLGVFNMICVIEMFLVLCMLSANSIFDKRQMFFMYLLGVTSVGSIMLINTLQSYDLQHILTSTARLGTTAVAARLHGMSVNIDPNYYGLFVIAALSVSYPLLDDTKLSKAKKRVMSILMVISVIIGLIALSRAFVITLILWGALVFIYQKHDKNFFFGLVALIVISVLIYKFLPQIFSGITERFNESDLAEGNGRISLITRYFGIWSQSFASIFLGIGLFVCTVHSMQLQYLFGGGIFLSYLMLAFAISQINLIKSKYRSRSFISYIPMLAVFFMSATVPVATSMTFMFPTIITLVAFDYINEVQNEAIEKNIG